MNPTGPLDVQARERIADRERTAAPLRIAAEGQRERLGWKSESRVARVKALAELGVARIAQVGGLVFRLLRRPAAPPAVTLIEPVAVDPTA